MDQRYHEAFREFKSYIEILYGLDIKTADKGQLEKIIAKEIDVNLCEL